MRNSIVLFLLCLILSMIVPSLSLLSRQTAYIMRPNFRTMLGHSIRAHRPHLTPISRSALYLSTKTEDDNSVKGKFKEMWKNYGVVAVGTYLSLYVMTLGSIFTSLDFDLFSASSVGFDPVAAVKKVCDLVEYVSGNDSLPNYIRENPRVGTFAIAWVITKFTEPARLVLTLYIVPKIARYLGRAPALPVK